MKNNKLYKYWVIFYNMFIISAFTFGGGFVIVSLMQKKFVDELHWLKEDEMLDLAAIAQSSPGAIAVNASILVGFRMAGIAGMLVAVIGTILPPLIIISIISVFYNEFRSNKYIALMLKGMQSGVAAVIFDVVVSLGKNVLKAKDYINIAIMVLVFIASFVFKINVIYIVLACIIFGIIRTLVSQKAKGGLI
ncbi:MAG: chromate transporter [Christensenellaceae bacterium]|nr:chromate transporter [Christensenellaceae bacterium]